MAILVSIVGYYERPAFLEYGDDIILVDTVAAVLYWFARFPDWELWLTDYQLRDGNLDPIFASLTSRFEDGEPINIDRVRVVENCVQDGVWSVLNLKRLGYDVTHLPDNFSERSVYASTLLKAALDEPVNRPTPAVLQLPPLRDPVTGLPWTWEPGQPDRPHW